MAEPGPTTAEAQAVVEEFGAAYAFAFRRYAQEPGEHGLQRAYELGRAAVGRQLSVLDLALIHHAALVAALRGARGSAEVARITGAAADFFLESLSTYEMLGRGFRETQELAHTERRRADMVRRLSSFLADASLALGATAASGEILRLVAEQARELTGAARCVAHARSNGDGDDIRAVSNDDAPGRETGDRRAAEWGDDGWTLSLVPSVDTTSAPDEVSVPIIALDGERLGEIRVSGKDDGSFTAVDRAVLVHLAQMTAAALERARLYDGSVGE